jgi:hypothetical protein
MTWEDNGTSDRQTQFQKVIKLNENVFWWNYLSEAPVEYNLHFTKQSYPIEQVKHVWDVFYLLVFVESTLIITD